MKSEKSPYLNLCICSSLILISVSLKNVCLAKLDKGKVYLLVHNLTVEENPFLFCVKERKWFSLICMMAWHVLAQSVSTSWATISHCFNFEEFLNFHWNNFYQLMKSMVEICLNQSWDENSESNCIYLSKSSVIARLETVWASKTTTHI